MQEIIKRNVPRVYILASMSYWIWKELKANNMEENKASFLFWNSLFTSTYKAKTVRTPKNTLNILIENKEPVNKNAHPFKSK